MEKIITAECENCDSSFQIVYMEELVSEELPCCCPFCGENMDEKNMQEEFLDDDLDEDMDPWEE